MSLQSLQQVRTSHSGLFRCPHHVPSAVVVAGCECSLSWRVQLKHDLPQVDTTCIFTFCIQHKNCHKTCRNEIPLPPPTPNNLKVGKMEEAGLSQWFKAVWLRRWKCHWQRQGQEQGGPHWDRGSLTSESQWAGGGRTPCIRAGVEVTQEVQHAG